MRFIADLHIHSRFSRATSKDLDPEHLTLWAQKKGITVMGTGDFTHPAWISELKDKLIEAEGGLYQLRPDLQKQVDEAVPLSCLAPTRFLLSGEISCIYKKNGRTRKIHHLILMPDMASVLRFNERLDRIGNITSDGRPILGLDSRDLLEIALEVSEKAFLIPAHIWTPWFSLFGSKSGFDDLEECFQDLTGHIHALETGLSSDPPMNRLLSALDSYVLVSNSDAHSPGKTGREANIFDTGLDYTQMIQAMTTGRGFMGTIEFFPEEGKYHLDGHRKCQIRFQPTETADHNGLCPQCGKPLTVGVLHRVHELSNREHPRLSKNFFSLIPLTEILSELLSVGPATKKVTSFYEKILAELGPELKILLDCPLDEIKASGGPILSEAVHRMRRQQVIREEGYDGQFGIIRLFHDSEKHAIAGQTALFGNVPEKPSRQTKKSHPKRKALKKQAGGTPQNHHSPGEPIFDPLNQRQRSAVLHQGGNLLIVAGPGTGKTMTLTHRIAHLIRTGIALPGQILALTFTRKAAREMAQRITTLLQDREPARPCKDPGGTNKISRPTVATFHGFCMETLRRHGHTTDLPPDFTLCSEWDSANLAREILAEQGIGKRSLGKFLRQLTTLRIASVWGPADGVLDNPLFPICREYLHRVRELGMLDFEDLEVETLRLLRNHPDALTGYCGELKWIFVDEYQDTNRIQVELLKALYSIARGSICAIGDPDQAIYGFRGADVKNFHRFIEDFPVAEQISLNRNYRSTRSILNGSAALLGKATPLEYEIEEGGPISLAPCRTAPEEAEMIVEQVERAIGGTSYFSLDSGRVATHEGDRSLGFGDIGVLYRLNSQGDVLEAALNRAGIPFVRSGETPLIARHPVNILWRFFQRLQYPDNPYYQRQYRDLLSDSETGKRQSIDSFDGNGTLPDLIDRAVGFHGFAVESEESIEALRRLNRLARDFEGDMATFLDSLSLERGIDHGALLGDRVALMTLHAAKGLEWPVVFIVGCEDRLMPCSLFGSCDEEEERRLFYVGMTRARSRLILSHVKQRVLNGRKLKMGPSSFLDAIPQDLLRPLERGAWKPRERALKQLNLFNA